MMQTRDRIVEVLAKYNIALPDAPLDALTMAMDRMQAIKPEHLFNVCGADLAKEVLARSEPQTVMRD